MKIPEIAKKMGLRPCNCLAFLKRIQESRNIVFLYKNSDTPKAKYYTTEEALKNVLPELFEEDKFAYETIKTLAKKIEILTNRIEVISSRLNKLEEK